MATLPKPQGTGLDAIFDWARRIIVYFEQQVQLEEEPPPDYTQLHIYTVAEANALSPGAGVLVYVSDETGGATLAFNDGTNWRRVQDRAIIA